MRVTIRWLALTLTAAIVLSKLLEPITGEADLLASGIVSACNMWWIESRLVRDESAADWLLPDARYAYVCAVWPAAAKIAHLLVQTDLGAAFWLRAIAHEIVDPVTLGLTAFTLAHLLCRVSFSAAAIRAADRRRHEQWRQRTRVQ